MRASIYYRAKVTRGLYRTRIYGRYVGRKKVDGTFSNRIKKKAHFILFQDDEEEEIISITAILVYYVSIYA